MSDASAPKDVSGSAADLPNGGAAQVNNVHELTALVQQTLQQMQEKFQHMSDQIIHKNILFK